MLSGRRLELLDPSPLDIEIEDIAHGLSFLARWNGQTIGEYPFSVAQHSLLVENIFAKQFPQMDNPSKLFALLHDSAEYVIGDMISPLKSHLGNTYEELDEKIMLGLRLKEGIDIQKVFKEQNWGKKKFESNFSKLLEAVSYTHLRAH